MNASNPIKVALSMRSNPLTPNPSPNKRGEGWYMALSPSEGGRGLG
jgi:hypothetical protein